jgi:hypothetical protein
MDIKNSIKDKEEIGDTINKISTSSAVIMNICRDVGGLLIYKETHEQIHQKHDEEHKRITSFIEKADRFIDRSKFIVIGLFACMIVVPQGIGWNAIKWFIGIIWTMIK